MDKYFFFGLKCVLVFCFFSINRLSAQVLPPTKLLHRAEKNLTRAIVHDVFSPPVASRIYLYACAASYETLIFADSRYRSLHGQAADFPDLHSIKVNGKVNYPLASVCAFFTVGKRLIFSEELIKDSVDVILKEFHENDPQVYENSVKLAEVISDSILRWAAKDYYLETRKKRRYAYSKNPGKWTPTPPGYMDAVEPYWSQLRPVSLDSAGQFKPAPPPAYDLDTASLFMKEVLEVYRITQNMDREKILVASFWDCNPFYLNTQGHLNFATKKLSPGGHWISIAGQVTESAKLDWPSTSAAYLLTSIALYDGFISCWDEKYRSQMIRPETIINARIDENWRPMLQTPPFPEYPSGHSVISAAAAEILTFAVGDNFSFDDYTEVPYGLPVRKFQSFRQASTEAGISRLYGGIHYRSAIEQGQLQGVNVGRQVLNQIRLKY